MFMYGIPKAMYFIIIYPALSEIVFKGTGSCTHIPWDKKDFLCELESGIRGENPDFFLRLVPYCL